MKIKKDTIITAEILNDLLCAAGNKSLAARRSQSIRQTVGQSFLHEALCEALAEQPALGEQFLSAFYGARYRETLLRTEPKSDGQRAYESAGLNTLWADLALAARDHWHRIAAGVTGEAPAIEKEPKREPRKGGGQLTYEAYCEQRKGYAYTAPWADLTPGQQMAWNAAAMAGYRFHAGLT